MWPNDFTCGENSIFFCIQPKELSAETWNLHTPIDSSIIHNRQKVEATQVYVDGELHKQNLVYKHNIISLKKEDSDTYYKGKTFILSSR